MALRLGVLMVVFDTTFVTAALPSIRRDWGFIETSLVWVVNAGMLIFGGFPMLGVLELAVNIDQPISLREVSYCPDGHY